MSVFRDSWTHWAGVPKHLYLDPVGELRSNELELVLQGMGTSLFVTAAAWQRARIERHGHILKEMLNRMGYSTSHHKIAELDESLAQCFNAKNAVVRVKSFSPEQLVLGKRPATQPRLTSWLPQTALKVSISVRALSADLLPGKRSMKPIIAKAYVELAP